MRDFLGATVTNGSNKRQINKSINVLKCLAIFAVICIHCKLFNLGAKGGIVVALCRFAVPFFFMVSGYFSFFDNRSKALEKYKDEYLVVKFHPREFEKDREATLNLIKDKGLNYSVLGQRINIPVELYLQNCQVDEILFFNTSTYFYNGFLFPKAKFVKLLPLLHKKCIENNVPCLEQMETLIKYIGD